MCIIVLDELIFSCHSIFHNLVSIHENMELLLNGVELKQKSTIYRYSRNSNKKCMKKVNISSELD